MREWYRRHAAWVLLGALALCMGLAPLLGRERTGPEGAEVRAAGTGLRAVGEEVPLRACLEDEPVYWEILRAWQTHPALDLAGPEAQALRAGAATRVWEDALWGLCVELDCGGETWLYRSLAETTVRPGESVAAGAVLGTAGRAPMETELGPHVHIERWTGGVPADPME